MAVLTAVQSGRWTDPATWDAERVPAAGDRVVIPAGITVLYDVVEGSDYDVMLGSSSSDVDIDIYGTLRFINIDPPTARLSLKFTGYIYIRGGGGKLLIGSKYNPDAGLTEEDPMQNPVLIQSNTATSYPKFRAIGVPNDQVVCIYGTPNVPLDDDGHYKIWTRLAYDSPSGNQGLIVYDDLNWQVGDIVCVNGTLYTVIDVGSYLGYPRITLSTSISTAYRKDSTYVVKINRKIFLFENWNSSSPSLVFSGDYSMWYFAGASWFAWRRGTGFGLGSGGWFATSALRGLDKIEYFSNYGGQIWLFSLYNLDNTPVIGYCGQVNGWGIQHRFLAVIKSALWGTVSQSGYYDYCMFRKCLLLGNIASGYYDECVISYMYTTNTIFGNATFRNCRFFAPGWSFGMSTSDHTTPRYKGLTFINCEFREPTVSSLNSITFSWRGTPNDVMTFDFYDCRILVSTVVWPSAGGRWWAPRPYYKFRNLRLSDGTEYREVAFYLTGNMFSDGNDVPSDLNVGHSYAVTLYGSEPFAHDFNLVRPGETVRFAVKRLHDCSVKVQLIEPKDSLWPIKGNEMPYTPVQEVDASSATIGDWVYYTITNPTDKILMLRIYARPSSSNQQLKFAYELSGAGSGGGGGDAGSIVYNITVSDGVTAILQDAATANFELNASDTINASLTDQSVVEASISVSDSVSASLQDAVQTDISVSAQDAINANITDETSAQIAISVQDEMTVSMQEEVGTSVSVQAQDSINTFISDSAVAEVSVSVQDSVSASITDSASVGVSVIAQDSTSVDLSDSASSVVSISVQDAVEAFLEDQASVDVDVTAQDQTEVTMQDAADVMSGTTYFISVSDSIEAMLSDEASTQVSVSAQELTEVTLQDSADVETQTTYSITVSDSINATFSDEASLSVGIQATDQIAASLQDQAGVDVSLSASDTLAATMQDQTEVIIVIDVDETTAATLQDTAIVGVSISASDSVQARLQDQASVAVGISATEATEVSMQEDIGMDISLAITEQTRAAVSDQAGVTVEAYVSETTPVEMDESFTAAGVSFVYEPIEVIIREKARLDVAISIDRIEVIVDVD